MVALAVAAQDEMVPFKQMQQLYRAVRSRSCVWVEFPDASHMDAYHVDRHIYWPAMRGFFEKYVTNTAMQ